MWIGWSYTSKHARMYERMTVRMLEHTHTHTHTHTHSHMYAHTHKHMYACMNTHTHKYIKTHTHILIHVCIHVHTHTILTFDPTSSLFKRFITCYIINYYSCISTSIIHWSLNMEDNTCTCNRREQWVNTNMYSQTNTSMT